MQKFIFGSLFLLANKLQVAGDRHLAEDDITTIQWFLTVMILQFPDTPPTLTEVAELMGSSRQNVKQLALKLQDKGFLIIDKDNKDARALRLKLTDKCQSFWEKREDKDHQFISELFKDLNEDEMNEIYKGLNKILERLQKMVTS
ncbi:MAG: transcriptional regulator [Clostridiales bacterium]|nr:transcriptional regulator [Clostridiales bacterium]